MERAWTEQKQKRDKVKNTKEALELILTNAVSGES